MIRNQGGQVVNIHLIDLGGNDYAGAVSVYVLGDDGVETLGTVGGGVATNKGFGIFHYDPSADETNFTSVSFIFRGVGAITDARHYDTLTPAQYAALQVQVGTAADYTVRDLCAEALYELNVYGPADGEIDYDDLATVLRFLVGMTDRFQTDRLLLFTVLRTVFPLTALQQTRTIGLTGSDYVATRPQWVSHVGVIPVGDTQEIPLHLYTREEWFDEPFKDLEDQYPRAVLYEPNAALQGTFTFWPKPTTAASFVFATPQALTVPATLDTILSFPPGYQEAWRLNLAKRIARTFDKKVTPDLREDARDALAAIRRFNDPGPPPSRADAAIVGRGRWDIFTGRNQVI